MFGYVYVYDIVLSGHNGKAVFFGNFMYFVWAL